MSSSRLVVYFVVAIAAIVGSFSETIESAWAAWPRHAIDAGEGASAKGADGVRLADVNGDGSLDIVTGWEQSGDVRLYLNPGRQQINKTWPAVTVGRANDVEDAVLADFDGDGAIDVATCSEGRTKSVAIHWAPRDRSRTLDAGEWRSEQMPVSVGKMRWMFAVPLQVDGVGGVDLVAGGKGENAAIGWFESPLAPRKLADWKFHSLRPVGWLMSLVAADMDDDGDNDLIFSDRKGKRSGAAWLENTGDAAASSWPEHPIGGQGKEAMFLDVADLDRDGLDDVLLAVKPQEILWLKRMDRGGKAWKSFSIPLPKNAGTAKAVTAGDIDGDGAVDVAFSCEAAEAPRQGLMWLSCEGEPETGKWIAHELSGAVGEKYDLVALLDLDGDGDLDAITTEETKNLGVMWYENPSR